MMRLKRKKRKKAERDALSKNGKLKYDMKELEAAVASNDFKTTNRLLFEFRRLRVTEKRLISTKAARRLRALCKIGRAEAERGEAEESDDNDERQERRRIMFEKMEQVLRTWKTQIKIERQKRDGPPPSSKKDEKTEKESSSPSKVSTRSIRDVGDTIGRSIKEIVGKPLRKRRLPDEKALSQVFDKRSGASKSRTKRTRYLHAIDEYSPADKHSRKRSARSKTSVIGKVSGAAPVSTRATPKSTGFSSSDMEATYQEIQDEETRTREIGEYEDKRAAL